MGAEAATSPRPHSLVFVRTKLKITALMCLFMTAVLASAVAHSRAPYGFEDPALEWLGPPSAIGAWADLTEFLGTPTIGLVLLACLTFGIVRRAFLRVAVYAALAAATLLINEHVAKPLVQRTLYGALTFPSGRVTSVCATALAMWLALCPLLGKWARRVSLVLGAAWTLLISLAVVGAHWHSPLDAVGSILMSVGIVTACAAVFDQATAREPSMSAVHAQAGAQE